MGDMPPPGTPSPIDGIKTPDGRYIVVRGRLWRATNPALTDVERTEWTRVLMAARRATGAARRGSDVEAARRAGNRVDRAKRALGERGAVWWTDGTPDYNRRLVANTPYRDWFDRAERFTDGILGLLQARSGDASVCPSDVARAAMPQAWRSHMEEVRAVARHLARRAVIVISQRGRRLDPDRPFKGPVRFAKAS
jgi:hypothetical protein